MTDRRNRLRPAVWALAGLAGALALAAIARAGAPPAASGEFPAAAPLPEGQEPVLKHLPFEADENDCSACHRNADPKNPGPLLAPVNESCFECHSDIQDRLKLAHAHAPALDRCTSCHNPHEAMQPALLVEEVGRLCARCHGDIDTAPGPLGVKHGAIDSGRKCLNCHDPHGSAQDHLLAAPAFDLCMQCHGTDDLKDRAGRPLANMKRLLDENPEWHVPLADKDCSGCHLPHASPRGRLLTAEYPTGIYAPYEAKRYALCFDCHGEEMAAEARTTTATEFRDGDRNLHHLHVNKATRGRTCHVCHEVHASGLPHQLRNGVAYGPGGWTLRINYTPSPNGGSCARTCHGEKAYDRTRLTAPAGPEPAASR